MSFLERDDKQLMVHNFRQVAEILALFRTSLRDAGIPRWVAAKLVIREYDMMVSQRQMPTIVFVPPPLDFEEEEDD